MHGMQHSVKLAPKEALQSVVSVFVGSGVYAVESRSEDSVTFSREKNPDFVLGCALLLLGLIPGLIYLGLAGGTVRLTVYAEPVSNGTRLTFGAERWFDRKWIAEWLSTVPVSGRDPVPKARWHSHPDD